MSDTFSYFSDSNQEYLREKYKEDCLVKDTARIEELEKENKSLQRRLTLWENRARRAEAKLKDKGR